MRAIRLPQKQNRWANASRIPVQLWTMGHFWCTQCGYVRAPGCDLLKPSLFFRICMDWYRPFPVSMRPLGSGRSPFTSMASWLMAYVACGSKCRSACQMTTPSSFPQWWQMASGHRTATNEVCEFASWIRCGERSCFCHTNPVFFCTGRCWVLVLKFWAEQPKNSHCLCIMTQSWPADPHCPLMAFAYKRKWSRRSSLEQWDYISPYSQKFVNFIPQVHYSNPVLAGLTPLNSSHREVRFHDTTTNTRFGRLKSPMNHQPVKSISVCPSKSPLYS